MGIVLDNFSLLIYCPVSIEVLKILLNGSEIISLIKCKILIGIPLGPEHLLMLSSDINSSISILSEVLKTNELGNELARYSV